MYQETLMSPMAEITTVEQVPDGLQYFINYISVLEGAKTKIKNLHWAAKKLEIPNKRGAHVYLDDFLEVVQAFQDTVAEVSQGILGEMNVDSIRGTLISCSTPLELINWITDRTLMFYSGLLTDALYVGIKSETETFIKDLCKYKYLFRLT